MSSAVEMRGPQGLALAGLLATLVLLPFHSLYELGLLLCVSAGIWAWVRGVRPWELPGFALFALCWGAYVVAALWSLPDAHEPMTSARTTLSGLRFVGYGWAACLLDASQQRRLARASAWVIAIWVVDALVQATFGVGLGGRNLVDRVSGIFGDADLKLGPVLGVLSALLLWGVERRPWWLQLLTLVALAAAVLVAGARAGWVSLGIVGLWWLWRRIKALGWRPVPVLGSAMCGLALMAVGLYATDPQFAGRVDRTLLLTHGDRAAVDTALAFRLPIWETAGRMALAHPFNGVGVRGFRHAYPLYAEPGDRWVTLNQGEKGAAHAHQLILELWCETGIPGLLLWLGAAVAVFKRWRDADQVQRQHSWGFAAALLALCFPLNTHLAFYSSFLGTVYFWLVALTCASLCATPERSTVSPVTAQQST